MADRRNEGNYEEDSVPETGEARVVLYTTAWCSYCRSLKRALEEASIEYAEVDIEEEPRYGAVIESLTGGFRTVPTASVCGKYLVNPTLDDIVQALEACHSYS